jgi:hypothetical protein
VNSGRAILPFAQSDYDRANSDVEQYCRR